MDFKLSSFISCLSSYFHLKPSQGLFPKMNDLYQIEHHSHSHVAFNCSQGKLTYRADTLCAFSPYLLWLRFSERWYSPVVSCHCFRLLHLLFLFIIHLGGHSLGFAGPSGSSCFLWRQRSDELFCIFSQPRCSWSFVFSQHACCFNHWTLTSSIRCCFVTACLKYPDKTERDAFVERDTW